ncbi:shroom isoform X2 [Rhipicephalus microplus]|uniref:shroom isoform X2 n=1 Tax=Rhipicephalus microplus TaxID=6941 RepID=UPI003F6AE607
MNVLNRLLGAAAGKQKNGESPPSSGGVSTRESLWQKASSLRQSLRGRSSRHDGTPGSSGGTSNRRPASLYLADSSSRCSKSRQSLRREWGSQRDLSREKRHAAAPPHPPSASQQLPQHQQQQSCDAGSDHEPDTAWSSTWTLPDSTSGSVPLPPPKQRSPRKLTKDSGYETSGGGGAHGEPDYVNREWVSRAPSPPPTPGQTSGPPSIGPTSPVGAGGSTPWTPGPGNPGAGARDTCRETGDDAGSSTGCFTTGESLRSPGGSNSLSASGDDDDMVTRRFKKGTVYSALASQSGLDFSPVVLQATRPSWSERSQISGSEDDSRVPPPPPPPLQERKPAPVPSHEKYPSWPVTPAAPVTSTACRSKSWTQETDYPKEKSQGYARPKKSFKISTQQLQPVLERACEPGAKKAPASSSVSEDGGSVPSANDVCFSAELVKSSECSADAYLSKYDEFLRQYQRWSEAPFLQRLYQEGERDGWPRATEAPQLGSESACDSLGSSGGSSQDTLKWHGSYSDLSAFSASNGSSLFDSGHSTLPDSGRLSPQSSCDGSLADGTQRLVSPSQAAVARSARVLQPKRHESESVLYYAPCEVQRNKSQQSSRPSECSRVAQLKAAFDPPCTMTAHSSSSRKEPPKMLFLDPEKKHRVSDPELKAIQKQAVLSFYKRQTSQDSKNCGHNTSSSGNRNRTLPRIPSSAKWSVAASEPSTSQPPSLTTTVNSVTSAMSPEAKDKPDAPWRGPRSWSVPDITQQLSVAPKAPWGPVVAATCKSLAEASSRRSCDGAPVSRTSSVNCRSSAGVPPLKKQLSVAVPKDSNEASRSSEHSFTTSNAPKFASSSQSLVSGLDQQVVQEDHAQIEAEVKDDVSAESRRDSHSLRPSVSGGRKAQLREVRLPDRGTPALQLLTSEGVTLAVAPAARPPGEEADTRGGGATGSDSVVDMVSQLSKPVDRRAQQDKLLDRAPEKLLESRVANNNNSTFNNNNNNNNAGGSPVTSVVTQHGRRSEVITATVLSGHKEVTPVHLALHARGGHQERNQDKGNSPLEKKTRSRDSPRSREKMIIPDERFASLEESIRSSQPNRRNQDKLFDRVHEKCLDVRIQGPLRGGDSSEGTTANGSPFVAQPPPAVPPRRSPSSDPKPPPRPPPKRSVAAPAVSDENGVDDEAELQRITERIAGHVNLAIAETPCPESLQPPDPVPGRDGVGSTEGAVSSSTAATGRPVSWTSLCSSPELPLPSPPPLPPAVRDLCSPPAEDDDEPLPPPPDDLDHVSQQQPGSVAVQDCDPADPRVYPKDSYMWYRTERKPGRQGFQGNYRRSYHGSAGGGDSGPDSCPGSDQGSEFASEEASSESSSSSSCPSSPLTFPPHSWPSPGTAVPQSATTAPSQDSTSAKTPPYEPADSLNNNNNSSTSTTTTTVTTTSTGTATAGGNVDSVSNNNNALPPTPTGGEQVACNGCHEHWTSSSTTTSAITAGSPPTCRRTNSATQTGPDDEWCVQLRRPAPKSQEELECERLSHDFASRYGDAALRSLLVPSPNQKTTSDYLEGLFDGDFSQNSQLDSSLSRRCSSVATSPQPSPSTASSSPYLISNTGNNTLSDENLPANSAYYTTSEPKAKFLTRFGSDIGKQEWTSDSELSAKKEELMASISRKLDVLRSARLSLREEASQNELLGRALGSRVDQLARPAERDKYRLHVDELDKIVSLILSLSGRLARVHNALAGLAGADEPTAQERRALESKRDKLSSQHEEARRLKESIDRRSRQVAQFLRKYLTPQEYADYDHFVRMKSKLLVDAREIDDKIRLGEEQLAALRAGTVATASWKSLASS